MRKTNIVVIDDHHIFRLGIRALLATIEDIELIGEVETADQALTIVQDCRVDVILMDVHLTKSNGIVATQQILAQYPSTKILGISSSSEDKLVVGMMNAGAFGYVLKTAPVEEFVLAIRTLSNHNSYFSKEISQIVFSHFHNTYTDKVEEEKEPASITGRELEVLKFIANGLTSKEVADKLYISPRTVETHRRNLMNKLKVRNIAGLVKYYWHNLIID